jgi:UDPglucose 6-dehydrogenase
MLRSEWLANICIEQKLPIIILGKAFKPETNIKTGSPSILLYNILNDDYNADVKIFDPISDGEKEFDMQIENETTPDGSYVYFIGTQHLFFKDFRYNANSVVIDPFRYLEKTDYMINNSIELISIGGSRSK